MASYSVIDGDGHVREAMPAIGKLMGPLGRAAQLDHDGRLGPADHGHPRPEADQPPGPARGDGPGRHRRHGAVPHGRAGHRPAPRGATTPRRSPRPTTPGCTSSARRTPTRLKVVALLAPQDLDGRRGRAAPRGRRAGRRRGDAADPHPAAARLGPPVLGPALRRGRAPRRGPRLPPQERPRRADRPALPQLHHRPHRRPPGRADDRR